MPVSEKQKQFARAWDKENMRTVACRLRTDDAEAFKKYCTENGTNPAAVIKKYIMDCLEEYYREQEENNERVY